MRIVLCLAFLSLAAAFPAASQHTEARFTAGSTTFADDGPANHLTVGGSVRFHLSRRWSVEPEFLHLRRNGTFVNDRDYLFWGNFAYDFRDRGRRVVPYWFAAPGIISHRSEFQRTSFTSTEAAFGSGFGVRVFLTDRVFVAPQIRAGMADGFFAEVTGSIGFVLRR